MENVQYQNDGTKCYINQACDVTLIDININCNGAPNDSEGFPSSMFSYDVECMNELNV